MGRPLKHLHPRHYRFVDEYLVDLNGTKAAIRAGYGPRNARDTACWLLRDAMIRPLVRRAMAARARRTRISADRVLKEYARIAFADIREVADWGQDGITPRPPAELSDDAAAAIAEISDGAKGGRARVKLHAKRQALDALARHLGLFEKYSRPPGNPAFRQKLADSARAKLAAHIEALAKEMGTDERGGGGDQNRPLTPPSSPAGGEGEKSDPLARERRGDDSS